MERLFALAQRVWERLRAALGPERAGRLARATGLSAFKHRFWRQEAVFPDGSRLLLRPHDQCIVDEVFRERAYDREGQIRPGQTVVDVGGHIGAFAVYAARRVGPSGRVVVCEPAPESLALLRENLARNGLGAVRVFPCALAEAAGEAELFTADKAEDNPAADTLHPAPGRRPVRVPVRTLDEIAEAAGVERVDHLKIDVEGAELRVLRGGEKTVARARRIVLEIHPGRVDPAEVEAYLSARGFSLRRLSEAPLLVEALKGSAS